MWLLIFLKKMKHLCLVPVIFALATCLISCGGSTGDGTPSGTAPLVNVAWPAITRDFSAPELANSATISLALTGIAAPYTWSIDRPSGTAAQVQVAKGPIIAPSATSGSVTIDFFRKPDLISPGPVMGRITLDVKILPSGQLIRTDGTPLGTVGYPGGDVSNVTVDISSPVRQGGDVPISVFAQNAVNTYAVPLEYVSTTVTSLGGQATVANHQIRGISEGRIRVGVTYSGRTASVDTYVNPATVSPTRFSLRANRVAWDPTRGVFWGTFGVTGTPVSHALAQIAPSSGAVSNVIIGLPDAGPLSVADDGTIAGVGSGSFFHLVNLKTGIVGSDIEFPGLAGNLSVSHFAFKPGDSSEVIVCARTLFRDNGPGPVLYRNGVMEGSVAQNPGVREAAYAAPDKVVGWSIEVHPTYLYEFTIAKAGITQTRLEYITESSAPEVLVFDNFLIGASGFIANVKNFSAVTTLTPPDGSPEGKSQCVAHDSRNQRIWLLHRIPASSHYVIRAYNSSTFQALSGVDIALAQDELPISLIRYGSNGLALHTTSALYVFPSAPGL